MLLLAKSILCMCERFYRKKLNFRIFLYQISRFCDFILQVVAFYSPRLNSYFKQKSFVCVNNRLNYIIVKVVLSTVVPFTSLKALFFTFQHRQTTLLATTRKYMKNRRDPLKLITNGKTLK